MKMSLFIANNVIFNLNDHFYCIIFYQQFPFLSILETQCKNFFSWVIVLYNNSLESLKVWQSGSAKGMAMEKAWTVFNFVCRYLVEVLINICNLLKI